MADKKSAKIVTNSLAEMRAASVEELEKLLHTAEKDLLQAQKSLRANELANPRVVRKMRRQIARIKTIMAQKFSKTNDKEDK